jgi:hypothetical protein
MIDNAIYTILAATTAVTSKVGTHIYTVVAAQQDVTAYIVIHLIDINPENTKDGVSLLDEARVQVNCFHSSKATCDELAAAIRTALDRYRGTAGSYTIDRIIFQDARNDFDEDRKIYQVQQDFIIRQKR